MIDLLVPRSRLLTVRRAAVVVGALWREARPVVQVVFQLRYLAGVLLSGGLAGAGVGAVVGGALVWLAATSSVYVLNGAADVTEDRANGSRRPVAAGVLGVVAARRAAVALGGLALAGAALVSAALLLFTACVLVLGVAYSQPPAALKRWTSGVALVGISGGLLTYAAGAVVGGRPTPATLVFAGLSATWMAAVGALTKDLPDATGDRAAGRRTVVVRHGDRAARVLAAGAALVVGAAGPVLAHLLAPALLVPGWTLAVGGLVVAGYALGVRPGQSRTRRRWPYRAFMVTQYAVHLTLLLPG
jgi:4-hydroxybenzoate polyprenyltransferase